MSAAPIDVGDELRMFALFESLAARNGHGWDTVLERVPMHWTAEAGSAIGDVLAMWADTRNDERGWPL